MSDDDDWNDGCDGTDDDEEDAPSSRPWWPDRERRRLTGRERLARTRERARLRRAKMRGIREAHRLGLRGGFVVAYPGTNQEGPFAVWHSTGSDPWRPDFTVWESAPWEIPSGCLYCTDDVSCERHDIAW